MKAKNICGARVREIREKKNLLLVDVVAALNVDYKIRMDTSALGRLERFERAIKDYELKAIAKVLEVSVLDLLGN